MFLLSQESQRLLLPWPCGHPPQTRYLMSLITTYTSVIFQVMPFIKLLRTAALTVFSGRPDWVYEEEVFQGDSAMWWSPKGDYLAFLRTNDSAVEEFPIPYFADKPPTEDPYPKLTLIKYPKPGSPNPIVDLLVLDTASNEVFTAKVESDNNSDPEKLITEVIWTGDNYLIQRISNRESDLLKIGVFNAKDRKGQISRTVDVGHSDGGWFEISRTLSLSLPTLLTGVNMTVILISRLLTVTTISTTFLLSGPRSLKLF